MADEPHEVVKLLLARMESHPEEFDGSHTRSRWYATLIDIEEYAPAEHAAIVKAKVAAIRLDAVHRRVMDELLNGDERYAKEKQETAYEQALMQKTAMQQYHSVIAGAYSGGGGGGGGGGVGAGTVNNDMNPVSSLLGRGMKLFSK